MIENMQAHLVGRNIIKLRVSPLVSFPILTGKDTKRDSQFNNISAHEVRLHVINHKVPCSRECLKTFSEFDGMRVEHNKPNLILMPRWLRLGRTYQSAVCLDSGDSLELGWWGPRIKGRLDFCFHNIHLLS